MNGHTIESLARLPFGAKKSLIRMHDKGHIGWRFHAMNTYLICTFLRSLENSYRTMTVGKKSAAIDMPLFDDLFNPTSKDVYAELDKQIG